MGIIYEAAKNFNLNAGAVFSGWSLSLFDGKTLYIEGLKRLGAISVESVRVITARGAVTVNGEKLSVKEITSDEIAVEGEITSVNIENFNKGNSPAMPSAVLSATPFAAQKNEAASDKKI